MSATILCADADAHSVQPVQAYSAFHPFEVGK